MGGELHCTVFDAVLGAHTIAPRLGVLLDFRKYEQVGWQRRACFANTTAAARQWPQGERGRLYGHASRAKTEHALLGRGV